MYNFEISKSATGCNEFGVVVVFDQSTGYYLEFSSPWKIIRVGWVLRVNYG